MSIVALKKVTVCGLIDEKEFVLKQLQALGCLHLVTLRAPMAEPEKAARRKPDDAFAALKFLNASAYKRHQVKRDASFEMDRCIQQVLIIQQQLRDVSDRLDFLNARIRAIEPWGDFTLIPAEKLEGYKFWFYIVPVGLMSQLPHQDDDQNIWQVVHRDNRFAYVVLIAREEPAVDRMPVLRTHTGTLSLNELGDERDRRVIELEDLRADRISMTRWISLINKNLAAAEDRAERLHAAEMTGDSESVFALQGWLPESHLSGFIDAAQSHGLAVVVEEPTEQDGQPPTLLDNPTALKGGEDLVAFYQTPGYFDWDPSLTLFFSFSLFFAMILSDAGYALIFTLGLIAFWQRLGGSAVGQRMRMMMASLFAASLVWGVMVGSYFGVTPAPDSLLGGLKILDLNDFDTMMKLSIIIGVLHLTFANVCKMVRLRQQGWTALAPLGWIVVMFGALFLWLDHSLDRPHQWLTPYTKIAISVGFLMVFIFSSRRPINRASDLIWRIFDGLQGVSGLTKLFGDVLSYLRLFALGLASASLALTFNNLALQVKESVEGPGLLFALLILVTGHTLNILLSIMSGVVHGLRLNVIEFYNWGLTDEGYPFKPFAKKEVEE